MRSPAVNIRMNEADKSKLLELAADMELSLAQTVKTLIKAAHIMRFHGIPHCAAGNPCLVPAAYYQYHEAEQKRRQQQAAPSPPDAMNARFQEVL